MGKYIGYGCDILKRIFVAAVMFLSLQVTPSAKAQDCDVIANGWYGGVNGGIPFGFSSFGSFGVDHARAGYEFGIIGGYRFNRIFSAEINAQWGKTAMSSQKCCVKSGYWMGEDGKTYYSPIPGIIGYSYGNLKSAAKLQQYMAQFNINLLGVHPHTAAARWSIDVSPKIGLVGSKATIMTINDNNDFIKGQTKWHLGLGGNFQAGYTFSKRIKVAVYSGITWLSGAKIEGIAKFRHARNFIWDNGVRVTYTFGKKPHDKNMEDTSLHFVQTISETGNIPHLEDSIVQNIVDSNPEPEEYAVDSITKVTVDSVKPRDILFPVIYFARNSTKIRESEITKMNEILNIMSNTISIRVKLTGWCDNTGGRAVNDRISKMRAETVRRWLVSRGIEQSRIHVTGKGIDYNEPDFDKARRVTAEVEAAEK